MTTEQLSQLSVEQQREQFHRVEVDGVDTWIERSLIPDGTTDQELSAWAAENVRAAATAIADGQDKAPGGSLHGRLTWVYTLRTNAGRVILLDAGN